MSQTLSPELMKESKSVATDRLRHEGRWNEASLFKDEAIKRLRAEGRTKGEASELGWAEMLAKFPPLPTEPNTSAEALDLSGADDRILNKLAAVELDGRRDMKWCYANLEHPRVQLETAPSLAAWGLLKFARENRAKFFALLLRAIEAPPKKADAGEDAQPPEPEPPDPMLLELDRMLERYQARHDAKTS